MDVSFLERVHVPPSSFSSSSSSSSRYHSFFLFFSQAVPTPTPITSNTAGAAPPRPLSSLVSPFNGHVRARALVWAVHSSHHVTVTPNTITTTNSSSSISSSRGDSRRRNQIKPTFRPSPHVSFSIVMPEFISPCVFNQTHTKNRVANPISGGGRALKVFEEVVPLFRETGVKHVLTLTERPGHAFQLAKELDSQTFSTIVRSPTQTSFPSTDFTWGTRPSPHYTFPYTPFKEVWGCGVCGTSTMNSIF